MKATAEPQQKIAVPLAQDRQQPKEDQKSDEIRQDTWMIPGFSMDRISIAPIQPKLKINAPNDKYEQEADSIANNILTQTYAPNINQHPFLQINRLPSPQQMGSSSPNITDHFSQRVQATKGKGRPMDKGTGQFMESHIGHHMDNVRVHTDASAIRMSEEINARAFTFGQDVYFNRGEYQPHTPSGKQLLAHELVHTVQQSGSPLTVQRKPNASWDGQAMADRYTTTELEEKIAELRVLLLGSSISSEDNQYYSEQLRIYEENLMRRHAILNKGLNINDQTRQYLKEQIKKGGEDRKRALFALNDQAKSAFGVAFAFSFLSELSPGDLQDANEDLIQNPHHFYGGYLVGLPVGVWHGLTGLLEGLWSLIQLASHLSPSNIRKKAIGEAWAWATDSEHRELRYQQMEQIKAVYDALQQLGEEINQDPTKIIELSGDLGEALGVHMGGVFTKDFVRKSAYDKGYIAGDLTGIIVFEILLEIILAVTTEGVGNLIRGVGVVGQGARASGRLASILRRMLEASPAIKNLLRTLNVGEDVLDAARATENTVDLVEDVVDSADNVLPFKKKTSQQPSSPLGHQSDNVTDLNEFKRKKQASQTPEAANNNAHFKESQADALEVPMEQEMPMAVGQTHYPEPMAIDPNVPQAMSRNTKGGGGRVHPDELAERRMQKEAQMQRRSQQQGREAARRRPMDTRPQDLAELQLTASREAGRLMSKAENGDFIGIGPGRRQDILVQYRRMLERSGLDRVQVNNRVGRMNELFSETPKIVGEGRAQVPYRSGGQVLEGQSLKGSSIPDIIRPRTIEGKRVNVHFNLKSDRIDQLSLSQAKSRAKGYTDTAEVQVFGAQTAETRRLRELPATTRKAQRRGNKFGNLPEGDRVGIDYTFVPDQEIQEAMVLEHFVANSPIVEVRFGSITYVRTATGFIKH